jgi:hypothetical protein
MSKTFRPWNLKQTPLLPLSPDDLLPKNHLVNVLLDLAAELNLGEVHSFYRQKDPSGDRACEALMLVVLLTSACCFGLPRSRTIDIVC